jgi:hypothetical protein
MSYALLRVSPNVCQYESLLMSKKTEAPSPLEQQYLSSCTPDCILIPVYRKISTEKPILVFLTRPRLYHMSKMFAPLL